jgi:RNA polymerase sigma-70 factor (ECF subfamily)
MARAITLPIEMARDPDEALVARAKLQPDAFDQLYVRYVHRVYGYLRTRTLSAEETADLTQTTFVQAMSSLGRFNTGRGVFAAWLFRIARNLAVDAHRKRKSDLSWDALPAIPDDDGRSPEELAIRADTINRLRSLLRNVDPRKRDLLALRFGAGLTSREIAEVVGRSEAAVKRELTRTIASLKENYRDQLL